MLPPTALPLQVAIVAVAAHLSQHPLGERFGLPTLARRYRQDVDALEQVSGWGARGRAPLARWVGVLKGRGGAPGRVAGHGKRRHVACHAHPPSHASAAAPAISAVSQAELAGALLLAQSVVERDARRGALLTGHGSPPTSHPPHGAT